MSKTSLTKTAIEQKFLELLSEETLNQISVKSLTAAVGINRNTFYYHYKSIPDLLETVVKNLVDELFENYPPAESLDDCLTAATDFVKQNEAGIRHIYESTSRPIFERYLWRICDYAVNAYLDTGPSLIFPFLAAPANYSAQNPQSPSQSSTVPDTSSQSLTAKTPHPNLSHFNLTNPEHRLVAQEFLSCVCFGLAMNYIRHGMSFDFNPLHQFIGISGNLPKN